MSKSRDKQIDETTRIMWVVVLALWFAYSLVHNLAGCNDAAKQDIKNFFSSFGQCEKKAAGGVLAAAENELLGSIQTAISGGVGFDSDTWKATGKSLAASFGADTLSCLTSSLYQEIISKKSTDMGVMHAMKALRPGLKLSYYTPDLERYVAVAFAMSRDAKSK